MTKVLIKNVSTAELQAAIAEALEKVTGEKWGVDIQTLRFGQNDPACAALDGVQHHVDLDLRATQITRS